MVFRFRKSVKILPGVRVNLGLNGASVSVGPRGASVSIGKRGVYANTSIPGTGISFRSKIGSATSQKSKSLQQQETQKELATQSVVLDLNEDGTIIYKDSSGNELSASMVKVAWQQNADAITSWLKDEADKFNDMDMINSLHYDMPYPNSEPIFEITAFGEIAPAKPMKRKVQKLSFLQKIFSTTAKQRYQAEVQKADEEHINMLRSWENDLRLYEKKKHEQERLQLNIANNFTELIKNDIDTMTAYLEKVYNGLDWPRETTISYDISDNFKIIYIDVDLPEIEDIPQKTATIALTGKKLNIKQKAEKQLRLEYAAHIHAIALRIASYTFATLPSLELVVLSGYSQRLDKATGNIDDEYLYSVKFLKDQMLKINYDNLEQLDTVESFENFEYIRNMTATGVFKKINPYTIE